MRALSSLISLVALVPNTCLSFSSYVRRSRVLGINDSFAAQLKKNPRTKPHNIIASPKTTKLHGSPAPSHDKFDRRDFVLSSLSTLSLLTTATMATLPTTARAAENNKPKILVLGGTGLVGKNVCARLRSLSVPYAATSRNGRDGTIALDFASPDINVPLAIENLVKEGGYTGVISCVGSIGTKNDGAVNASSGLAAIGARRAGATRFVYIGVAPEVRDAAGGFDFLKEYMAGKENSVDFITKEFTSGGGDSSLSYTIINPTFIYGGDAFGVNPPRVASGYGSLVEGLLSTGLFRFAAGVTPGLISVALEPPVSVEDVAAAAVAGGLGAVKGSLDTHDDIVAAAKKN